MLFGSWMWAKVLRDKDFRITGQTIKQIATKCGSLNLKGGDGRGQRYNSIDEMWE